MKKATHAIDKTGIVDLLRRSNRAVERALVVLFELQTTDERAGRVTRYSNKVGFGAFDANIFSSFAHQVQQGYQLSQNQLDVCRKEDKHGNMRIARYWKQLQAAADTKAARKATAAATTPAAA